MDRPIVRLVASAAISLSLVTASSHVAAVIVPDPCAGISAASDTPLTTVRIASGLLRPIFVTSPPGDNARLFVVEQDGRIRLVKNGVLQPTPFLDISALTLSPADPVAPGRDVNERGLLGLAFHPGYASNGWFFVFHSDNDGNNEVVRYERSSTDPDRADPNSRQVVTTFPHPIVDNHNGGMIVFGPEGHLYIGTGDGGGGCDPFATGQSPGSPLAKILRIDVNALPYTVPASNPFVGHSGYLPEIWAMGLRNPWRFSFDRLTGDLYIGDVGQNLWEEIDFTPASAAAGVNYGWSDYEGTHCEPNPSCTDIPSTCDPGHELPVLEYGHDEGCSVSGGYVYRGCRMPDLRGTYFYADFCAAFIRSFRISNGVAIDQRDRTSELAPGAGLSISQISSFGEDARGEMYILDRGGEVFKIVPVLSSLEVSGLGATAFLIGKRSWSWENLQATSQEPVVSYRVYRQSIPGDPFVCVHKGSSPTWTGGDPSVPAAGAVFSYVITALNAAGAESSAGVGSDGTPRVLSGAVCP